MSIHNLLGPVCVSTLSDFMYSLESAETNIVLLTFCARPRDVVVVV